MMRRLDSAVFDAAMTCLTRRTLALLAYSHWFDVRKLDRSFDAAGQRVLQLGERLRPLQSGRIYNYLTAVFVWTLAALTLSAVIMLISSRR